MFGGIFEQVSPLGFQTSLGGLELDKCQLTQWMKTQSAAEVQKAIKELGARSLVIDGLWGPCSESAFQKIVGAPTSKESLSKIGISCNSFEKTLTTPVSACQNGQDAVDASSPAAPDIAPATVSQFQPQTMPSLMPLRPIQPIRLPLPSPPGAEAQLPPPPVDLPGEPPPGSELPVVASQEPDWKKYAMYAGIAAALGLGIYLVAKKPAPRGRTSAIGGRV